MSEARKTKRKSKRKARKGKKATKKKSRRRRKKRRRVRSSYPLTHVLLDFQSVVGVDGRAIAVFEKLRRFAAREGVVLVLSGLGDRPELRRLTRIALYGEDYAPGECEPTSVASLLFDGVGHYQGLTPLPGDSKL